jgi:hypothetical protein
LKDSPDDANPGHFRTTFRLELVRAACLGTIETILATFAILIAVNRFESGPAVKALIIAAPALGLLGSLVVVPLAVRNGLSAGRASGTISLISCVGFAIAAAGAETESIFVTGVTLGIGILAMAMPLQTHYIRRNYPNAKRGRLFSITVFVRAVTSMIVSWGFGVYLDADFNRFPDLLWVVSGAAAIAAVCQFLVPEVPLRVSAEKRHPFLESVHVTRHDKVFIRLLIATMVLGIGVLSSAALRVDYLANPVHGLQFDVKTISLITGIIPSLTRLLSTFFWGWLFDHVSFFRLRNIVNSIFIVATLLYFLPNQMLPLLIGSGLFGLARGGGEIMFSLWVTKLAPAEKIADYMSVHTFCAGLRALSAPFIGFYLVQWANVSALVALTCSLALVAIFLVQSGSRLFQERERSKSRI